MSRSLVVILFSPEAFTHVSFAAVAQDRDDHRARRKIARERKSRDNVRAGADSYEQTFFPRHPPSPRLCFFAGDCDLLISHSWLESPRHSRRPHVLQSL